jgi:hypothetical protein
MILAGFHELIFLIDLNPVGRCRVNCMPCHRHQRVPVSGNEEPAEATARMGESRRILRMGCVGKGLAEVRGGSAISSATATPPAFNC